jgi:hypothetical protein
MAINIKDIEIKQEPYILQKGDLVMVKDKENSRWYGPAVFAYMELTGNFKGRTVCGDWTVWEEVRPATSEDIKQFLGEDN